ncbi:(2Fe-2S) ferredoxin domain-containing protein [Ferrovibrio sp.]|uniref:(2Fe-2S) ferredoxin domain-containing protein n=1 Tax=Ferrovibrio sp. TaxID=1917215 RepID=UPI00311D59C0
MSKHDLPPLHPVDPDWSTGLVLVCSECEGGRGADLADAVKQAMKAAGHRKDVRVARVRCLGICPKRGIAVTVTAPDRAACSFVAAPKDRAAVADALRGLLLPGADPSQ